MSNLLYEIKNLQIKSTPKSGAIKILNNINFNIKRGEILGLIGESGSGKSMLGCALLEMVPVGCLITKGSIVHHFNSNKIISKIRGVHIAMISQDPMQALNPLQKIKTQFTMILRRRFTSNKKSTKEQLLRWMKKVNLHTIPNILDRYPHQLSGGQMQRVMIAMAMSINPDFIVADEITTGLDAGTKMDILNLLASFQKTEGFSVLLISHDLKCIQKYCHRIAVLQCGEIVRVGSKKSIIQKLKDNYGIAVKKNKAENTEKERDPVLDVKNLYKSYGSGRNSIPALKNITFTLYKGETLGIIGESGSGKTTLVKTILNILKRDSGDLFLNEYSEDKSIMDPNRNIGAIFQDSQGSLNPKMKIFDILSEPLTLSGYKNSQRKKEKILIQLKRVQLDNNMLELYPNALSGGQRQRVSIARALLTNPSVVVLDEPTSALDVKTQGEILNLLLNIQKQEKLSYIFISHDLEAVSKIADSIAVLYKGEIIESGSVKDVLSYPSHNYTKKLIYSNSWISE